MGLEVDVDDGCDVCDGTSVGCSNGVVVGREDGNALVSKILHLFVTTLELHLCSILVKIMVEELATYRSKYIPIMHALDHSW